MARPGQKSCPNALIRQLGARLGSEVQTSWGMMEFSPIGTITPPGAPRGEPRAAGRSLTGLDLKLPDAQGVALPQQRCVVGRHPAVGLVAVIGRVHPKWGERPILIVEARPGEVIDGRELLATLKGAIADWQLPDEVNQVEAMPLAATGKIDKLRLRADYANGEAAGRRSAY